MKYILFNLLLLGLSLGVHMSGKANSIVTIAHRGASALEPENTLAAFEKAISLGVDAIELDVYCCASGEIVVIHDKKVNRTTNGTGYVEQLTLNELKKLDAGNNQKIPTLEEVFELVNRRCIINIELKGKQTEQAVADLIQTFVLKKGWNYSHFLVSSFDHHKLQRFNTILPDAPIAMILGNKPLDYAECTEKLPVKVLCVYLDFVDEQFIADAHARGVKLYTYVVNNEDDFVLLKKMRIDGIFSDFPEKLIVACTE